MRKMMILGVVLCLVGSCAVVAQAQSKPGPPKVIQIFREEVKPGHGASHAITEAGWPAAFAKANWPTHYIAMTSTSGPSEAWFISGYDSFAAMEQDQQAVEKNTALNAVLEQLSAKDSEHLTATRGITAVYRGDLSYRPGVNIAEYRYFTVRTTRVRPGYTQSFVEGRKMYVAASEKANVDMHVAVFEVVLGAPTGTFLVFRPVKSLAEMDVDAGPSVRSALGEEGWAKWQQHIRESVMSSELNAYAFSPKMSYVSKEWVAAAPDFWAPQTKPVMAAKSATAKTVPAKAKAPQQ